MITSGISRDQPHWTVPSFCFPQLWKPWGGLHPTLLVLLPPFSLHLRTFCSLNSSHASLVYVLFHVFPVPKILCLIFISDSLCQLLFIFQNQVNLFFITSTASLSYPARTEITFFFLWTWKARFICLHYSTNKLFVLIYLHIRVLSYYIRIIMEWDKS